MHAWHTTRAGDGRRVLLPDEARTRRGVRTLIRTSRSGLLLFCFAGDHLHDASGYDSPNQMVAGHGAACVTNALRRITDVPLEPSRRRPVESRSHMRWLLRYIWRQPEHHGLSGSLPLWTGSSFLDTIGARWVHGWRPPLRAVLPRLTARDIYTCLDLPPEPFVPLDAETLRRIGARRVVAAASAAVAAPPDLRSRTPVVVLARAIAARAARFARILTADMAAALASSPRTVQRLATRPVPAGALDAFRKRLGLELFLEGSGSESLRPP